MPQPKEPGKSNIRPYDSAYGLPSIVLLGEKHWSYLQRRYHMTPRELEVAKLVCQGFNNSEIAKDLKIKHGTVKTHLRNVYRRIRVKSKIAMLLKLVDAATKFSAKSGVAPPIPIVEVEKLVKKPSAPAKIRKEEK